MVSRLETDALGRAAGSSDHQRALPPRVGLDERRGQPGDAARRQRVHLVLENDRDERAAAAASAGRVQFRRHREVGQNTERFQGVGGEEMRGPGDSVRADPEQIQGVEAGLQDGE